MSASSTHRDDDALQTEVARLRREVAVLRAQNAALQTGTHRRPSRRPSVPFAISEADFLALFEQFPQGLVLYDAQRRYQQLNVQAEALCGRTTKELRGLCDEEVWPKAVTQDYFPVLVEAAETGEERSVEWTLPPALGGKTLVTTYLPLLDADGQTRQLLALTYDITERRQAEGQVRRSAQHTRTILDSLFAFVGVLEPDGTLLEANRAPLEAAGLTLDDVRGKKFWDCYWWTHDEAVRDQLRAACERTARGEPTRYDVSVRVADGALLPIDFMLTPTRRGGHHHPPHPVGRRHHRARGRHGGTSRQGAGGPRAPRRARGHLQLGAHRVVRARPRPGLCAHQRAPRRGQRHARSRPPRALRVGAPPRRG